MQTTTIAPVLNRPAQIQQPSNPSITWETNYNNKMGCNGFIHIDLKPARLPLRSSLENIIINISTADHSHPPVKTKVYDMLIIQIKNIPCAFTLASHGMDELEFADYMINKHLGKINVHTDVAVYYYKKIL